MKPGKKVHIVGGGTVGHLQAHLALCAPAYGTTAKRLAALCQEHSDKMEVVLHLTKMAGGDKLETYNDLSALADELVFDRQTKVVIWNPAVHDFSGVLEGTSMGKYNGRLDSSKEHQLKLVPLPKLVKRFRQEAADGAKPRKDIFLVTFKATCGATQEDQYAAGLNLLKSTSSNLVLANDVLTRLNMVIVPEEASYHVTTDRQEALRGLVEMIYLRSHLTFTRSTVVAGEPVPWDSPLIPQTLRTIVDYCISRGAYKAFRGVTAGHFAAKLGPQEFLTSRRKTDFNDMKNVGLVKVKTDGPDNVIAYGSRPSVGGQSQRILFADHPEFDCVVHFHCPIKSTSLVPTVSQREFECGSHECGKNTSQGLARFGNLSAVFLDNHGPNIVFSKDINPQEVIDFIEANFELEGKTGGYVPVMT